MSEVPTVGTATGIPAQAQRKPAKAPPQLRHQEPPLGKPFPMLERVEALARELFARMVTNPAYANKERKHLAADAVQHARDFYDVADELLS